MVGEKDSGDGEIWLLFGVTFCLFYLFSGVSERCFFVDCSSRISFLFVVSFSQLTGSIAIHIKVFRDDSCIDDVGLAEFSFHGIFQLCGCLCDRVSRSHRHTEMLGLQKLGIQKMCLMVVLAQDC